MLIGAELVLRQVPLFQQGDLGSNVKILTLFSSASAEKEKGNYSAEQNQVSLFKGRFRGIVNIVAYPFFVAKGTKKG